MGEAARLRLLRAGEHGRTLARVARQHEHTKRRIRPGESEQRPLAAVGAAVDHDENGLPVAQDLGHDLLQTRTVVVGRQQDKVGSGSGHDVEEE